MTIAQLTVKQHQVSVTVRAPSTILHPAPSPARCGGYSKFNTAHATRQKWSASVGHVQGRKRQPQSVKELENNNWEVGPFTYTSEMIGKPPEPIAEVDWSYDTEPKRDPPPHASDDASWSHLSMAFMLGAAVASVVLLFAFRRKICLVRERCVLASVCSHGIVSLLTLFRS